MMYKFVRDWLHSCLGILIDMTPREFATQTICGTLLAKVLEYFGVITKEQLERVVPTRNPNEAYTNFVNYIAHWLKMIGITLDPSDIKGIVHGHSDCSLRLFYDVYLCLGFKNKLYRVTKQRLREKVKLESPPFEVTPIGDLGNQSEIEDHPLGKNLKWDIIRWHKDKRTKVENLRKKAKEDYYSFLKSQERDEVNIPAGTVKKPTPKETMLKEIEKLPVVNTSHSIDYRDLLKHPINRGRFIPSMAAAKNQVSDLKRKKKLEEKHAMENLKQQNELLQEIWKKIQTEQEDCYEDLVKEKSLSQSLYEKQMISKMINVKNQIHTMTQRRMLVNLKIFQQRENDIVHRADLEEKKHSDLKMHLTEERERISELHTNVKTAIEDLQKKKVRECCEKILSDIIDIAMQLVAYHEEYLSDPDPSFNQFVGQLFIKSQPIMPLIDDLDEILYDRANVEGKRIDTLYREIQRQETLDAYSFQQYQNFWTLRTKETEVNDEVTKTINNGMNVICFVVNRLLSTKYPPPKARTKPSFCFEKTIVLNGYTDYSNLPILKKLLEKQQLVLVEINDCVEHCVKTLKKELSQAAYLDTEENDHSQQSSESNVTFSTESKFFRKGKKMFDENSFMVNAEKNSIANKKVQTPKAYSTECELSKAAILAQKAIGELNCGEPLENSLIVEMLIEYLYTIKNNRGFVLINFPTDYNQAVILEEALTSIKLQKKSVDAPLHDLVEINEHKEIKIPHNKNLETSFLFPNYEPETEPEQFITYLTSYIEVCKSEKPLGGQTINDQTIEVPLEENADDLYKMYARAGCLYKYIYSSFDTETLKGFARAILGEIKIPRKPSIELYDKSFLFLDNDEESFPSSVFYKIIDDTPKQKKTIIRVIPVEPDQVTSTFNLKDTESKATVKGKGKEKIKKNLTKASSHNVSHVQIEHKEVQVPALEDEYNVIYVTEEKVEVKPGDKKWVFTNWPLSKEILLLLANIWECVEKIYVNDFYQLFYAVRQIQSGIGPYLHQSKNYMDLFVIRPDNKPQMVEKFQTMFNSFEADLRVDEEVKGELFNRTDELRTKLREVTEIKKTEAYSEKQLIVEEKWVEKQMYDITLTYYVGVTQLETERLTDTIHVINDYYFAIFTGKVVDEQPFTKEFSNYSLNILEHHTDAKGVYLTEKCLAVKKKGLNTIAKLKEVALKLIAQVSADLAPKPSDSKKKSSSKIKSTSNETTLGGNLVAENSANIFEEWKTAIMGEIARATLRLNENYDTALKRYDVNMTDKVMDLNNEMNATIETRYQNEMQSIDTLCDVIENAIEAQCPIDKLLVLDGDKFYVDNSVTLEVETIQSQTCEQRISPYDTFSIEQLKNIQKVLTTVAPSGIMPYTAFLFLLQKILIFHGDDYEMDMVPKIWQQLTPEELESVMKAFFENNEYIYWKDFILNNLPIDFPITCTLLATRKKFQIFDTEKSETISLKNLNYIDFWFEDGNDLNEVECADIKTLLGEMYKINDEIMNYNAMLTDCCKHTNPVIGFARALSLILDKPVSLNPDKGKVYAAQNNIKTPESINSEVKKDQLSLQTEQDTISKEHRSKQSLFNAVFESEMKFDQDRIIWEEEECENCDMCNDKLYVTSFRPILLLIGSSLTWHAQVRNIDGKSFRETIQSIFNSSKNKNETTVCNFVFFYSEKLLALLKAVCRFTRKKPIAILKQYEKNLTEGPKSIIPNSPPPPPDFSNIKLTS